MQPYLIEGSNNIPTINFDADKNFLEIKGMSMPENSYDFFEPINKWIDDYVALKPESTLFNVSLTYFNTSTSKCLLTIFKKLEVIAKEGKELKINWYYSFNDDDMEEAGKDFQALINVPFIMIETD